MEIQEEKRIKWILLEKDCWGQIFNWVSN